MSELIRVVVVEDERQIIEVIRRALDFQGGYEVVAIWNAADAMVTKAFEDARFLICNMMLSSPISGLDVLKRVHRDYPHVKRIISTAMGKEQIDPEALALADDVLIKPWSLERLKKALA